MISTILFCLLIISIFLNIYLANGIYKQANNIKNFVEKFIDAQQSEFSEYQVNRVVDYFINSYKDL